MGGPDYRFAGGSAAAAALDTPDLSAIPDLMPAGALVSNMPRAALNSATQALAATGRLRFAPALWLRKGVTYTSLSFMSGSTAGATLTHAWFSLYDLATLARIRVTSDDTAAAWATNTVKTLNFATPFVPSASGFYRPGLTVVGTTLPTFMGQSATPSQANGVAPIRTGDSATTGLTDPASAPDPAGAVTAVTGSIWCWAS